MTKTLSALSVNGRTSRSHTHTHDLFALSFPLVSKNFKSKWNIQKVCNGRAVTQRNWQNCFKVFGNGKASQSMFKCTRERITSLHKSFKDVRDVVPTIFTLFVML